MRERVSARQKVDHAFPPGPVGRASQYMRHVAELPSRLNVVLYCRESDSDNNEPNENKLKDQERFVRYIVEQPDCKIVAAVPEIASGWAPEDNIDRGGLAYAVEIARKHGAVIVAESTDRFLRSRWYDTENQGAWPKVIEFEKLRQLTHGVTLATVQPPDMPPPCGAAKPGRGQWAKGRRGGRPRKPGYKKRRQQRLRPRALKLRAVGITLARIAEELRVAKSTVQRWIDAAR